MTLRNDDKVNTLKKTFYDMKILAFILIILGMSKVLFSANLSAADLYPLSHIYRWDPVRVHKQICGILIGDGIVSTLGGLFLMFLV